MNNVRKVYLIDTENIETDWIYILNTLGVRDKVLLFYTCNSKNLRYKELEILMQYKGTNLEFIECNIGKNALDFQLVSYLGYLLKTAPKTQYIIVSNDLDYKSIEDFWNDKGYNVIIKNIFNKKYIENDNNFRVNRILEKCNIAKEYRTGITLVLQKYNVVETSKIHNELNIRFPEFRKGELYSKIKKELINLYKYISV